MDGVVLFYIIGCVLSGVLTMSIIDVNMDITNGEEPDHWLNDFIMSSVRFGAVLLSWYTIVTYLVVLVYRMMIINKE